MPQDKSAAVRRRMVARHEIRESLQEMILNGERRPGTKLIQQQLAKRFGVAQGVIREALLELQVYGLVETVDNRGMFVSKLNTRTLLGSFDVREVHEALAARLCCERITRLEIRELTAMANEMFTLAQQGKLMDMAGLDREFHQRLIRISGNTMLIRLAGNYRLLGKAMQISRDAREVRDEHLAILKAIEEGRADDAERLMKVHIRTAKNSVERELAAGTFVPRWLADEPVSQARGGPAAGRLDAREKEEKWQRSED